MSDRKLCVYHLIDPRNDEVFYVGAGTMRRPYVHEYKVRLGRHPNQGVFERISDILKTEPNIKIEIVLETFDKSEAGDFEKYEIARIGLSNLCNKVNGGGGGIARILSFESRQKLSKASKGRIIPIEQRLKTGKTLTGRKAINSRLGRELYELTGKTRPQQVCDKISKSLLGHTISESTKQILSKKNLHGLCPNAVKYLFFNSDYKIYVLVHGLQLQFCKAFNLPAMWPNRYTIGKDKLHRQNWTVAKITIDLDTYYKEHNIDKDSVIVFRPDMTREDILTNAMHTIDQC